jgi:hypothetical protein
MWYPVRDRGPGPGPLLARQGGIAGCSTVSHSRPAPSHVSQNLTQPGEAGRPELPSSAQLPTVPSLGQSVRHRPEGRDDEAGNRSGRSDQHPIATPWDTSPVSRATVQLTVQATPCAGGFAEVHIWLHVPLLRGLHARVPGPPGEDVIRHTVVTDRFRMKFAVGLGSWMVCRQDSLGVRWSCA